MQGLAESLPKTSRDVAAMLKLETAELELVGKIFSTIDARAQRLAGAVRPSS